MKGRVIVVGSVNVDLMVSTERLPAPGETVVGGRFSRHDGGKGGNQAVAASRMGAMTAFIGAVGGDAFGVDARAALAAEGIDVEGLLVLRDEPTGVALIVVDEEGENQIAVASGANAALSSIQVRAAFKRLVLTPADVVLVGHEIRTGATHEALRLARIAGATAILNPAPAHGLESTTLDLATILTPNEGELAALGGDTGSPAARAKRLLGRAPGDRAGDRAVLVSLGAKGALLVAGGRAHAIPAPRVEVVDTVGAGDTLNGALAAGLAAGLELAEASRRAVVAASFSVAHEGARAGMPTADALARRLA
ncbi:MAG: ribokinase [Chloroflexota bacterium]|nr:ribokinase [Chloroflexota bacterium]